MTDLCDLPAIDQRRRIDRREVSARELLDAHLERIAERNGQLNAIVALDPDVASRYADAIDASVAANADLGPLAGLVTAFKDLAETADFPTTYGSPVFAGHRPPANNLLVDRMLAAGAVPLGKTNVPEFGAGCHTFNPVYGTTRNAHDPTRSAGGSSGGAAVGLATGMLAIADGSDLGGSLRNPAAWNNVVGFRSSPGVVPNIGPGLRFPDLGVAGAMGRTVDDLSLLLGVIAVADSRDPANRGLSIPSPVDPLDGPVRVAWSPTLGGLPVEQGILAVLERFVGECEALGCQVSEAEPDFGGADECFETLRSWGMANGQVGEVANPAMLKAALVEELERGQRLSGGDVASAIAHLQTLWRRAHRFFERYELLIGPVSQVAPFPAEWEYPTEVAGVPMERYLTWMRSTSRITAMQLPALALPCGFDADGLPVGAQLIGGPRQDLYVLRAGKTFERLRRPAGS